MKGLTYDTGALIAAEADQLQMWRLHEGSLRREIHPFVPSNVLAQAWRGGPQPLLSRLLKGCVIEAFDENGARAAGKALAAAGTCDVVDVAVVVGALSRGDAVVTTDPKDLARIADGLDRKLELHVL